FRSDGEAPQGAHPQSGRVTLVRLAARYRATGADPLGGDPTRAHHGVAMEGYFWRLTDRASGRVVIALCGANRGPRGPWATRGLAAWPQAFLRTAAVDGAWTDATQLGVRGGYADSRDAGYYKANRHQLNVELGADTRLNIAIH